MSLKITKSDLTYKLSQLTTTCNNVFKTCLMYSAVHLALSDHALHKQG